MTFVTGNLELPVTTNYRCTHKSLRKYGGAIPFFDSNTFMMISVVSKTLENSTVHKDESHDGLFTVSTIL